MYNKETLDILNYMLIKNGKPPISRSYKLNIKDIGCNAKCPICEDWSRRGDVKRIKTVLYETFKNIASHAIKYKHIQILGGEPMLIFNDILKIVKIGIKNNITFDFPTNGSLLTYEKIDCLINIGLDNFTFSIDFPNHTHNSWRGLPGSFEKIINFTKHIKERGVKVQWNTVVGKFNVNEIKDFQELYLTVKPDVHNFILIEDNGGESQKNLLEDNEIRDMYYVFSLLENINKDIEVIKNGFMKIGNSRSKETNLCFIPMKTITYTIDEKGYKISPCYHDVYKETDLREFTMDAITKGCDKCNSSCKENYNIYFLELIKKYKLSSK